MHCAEHRWILGLQWELNLNTDCYTQHGSWTYRATALLYAIGVIWANLRLKTFRVFFATYGGRQNNPLCGGAQSQVERLHWFSVWYDVLFFVDVAYPAHPATQLTSDDFLKIQLKVT